MLCKLCVLQHIIDITLTVQGLVASSQFITMEKMEHLIQNGNFDIKSSIARSPYLDEYPNLVEMLKLENDKRILKLLDYIGL